MDGSDNFETRYIISDICADLSKVHVYGAIFQFEGQVSVFNYQGGPHYRDVYNKEKDQDSLEDSCSNSGVLGLLPGIIGNLQATETIKIILGYKSVLSGVILEYNALTLSFKKFKVLNTSYLLQKNQYKYVSSTANNTSLLQEINVLQLYKILHSETSKHLLIDVRSKEEHDAWHLAGSLSIPLGQLKQSKYSSVDLQNKICFIYCSLDSRSIFASHYLIRHQSNLNVVRVKGGLNAWSNVVRVKDLDSVKHM